VIDSRGGRSQDNATAGNGGDILIEILDSDANGDGGISIQNDINSNGGNSDAAGTTGSAGDITLTANGAQNISLSSASTDLFAETGSGGTTTIGGAITVYTEGVYQHTNAGNDVVSTDADVTITANGIDIADNTNNNAFQTTGALRLQTASNTTAMSLNRALATSSDFDLSSTEIQDLTGNGTPVDLVIGSATSTSTMTIGGAVGLSGKTLSLLANAFSDGDTTINVITATDLNMTANGGSIGGATTNNAIDTSVTNFSATATSGNVYIDESGGIQLTGIDTGDFSLNASGAITDTGTINITGLADLSGTAITLGDGTFNAATLTFNSAGAVAISEDSTMDIVGTNTAGSADLDSTAVLSDTGATSIAIGNL
ncbi:MAG: hypothetical protein GY732_06340, partial [Gammaproteobacteria bacterium]|nr:hypothetical protein [Gammaproteobacteria bacterium]